MTVFALAAILILTQVRPIWEKKMKFNLRLPDNEKSWLLEHAQARNITPTSVLRQYIRTLPQRSGEPLAPKAPNDLAVDAEVAAAVKAYKRGLLSLEDLGKVIKGD